jgi:murein L,D-transpeptidase YafK
MALSLPAVLLLSAIAQAEAQAAPDRVTTARQTAGPRVASAFQAAGVAYPPGEMMLRVFKWEGELELWAGARGEALTLVRTYAVCGKSGELGPKRRLGDLQVPEGVYRIDRFNPRSNFHLSLGVDYPNASDRVLSDRRLPGGDIFIHGGCATIGCVPIGDEGIEELYLAALDARVRGQKVIPVHVFPHRMDEAGMKFLEGHNPTHLAFWRTLQPIYAAFEACRRPPRVAVDPKTGAYRLEPGAGRRCRTGQAAR